MKLPTRLRSADAAELPAAAPSLAVPAQGAPVQGTPVQGTLAQGARVQGAPARSRRLSAVAEPAAPAVPAPAAPAPAAPAPRARSTAAAPSRRAAPVTAEAPAPRPAAAAGPRPSSRRAPARTAPVRVSAQPGAEGVLTGLDALRATVRAAVVAEIGPTLGTGVVDEDVVRALLEQHLDDAARSSRTSVAPAERAQFVQSTLADMLGWGPLTPLMQDPSITEIMVNGLDQVWVERLGRIERTDVRFPSLSAYRVVLDRMLAVAGRRVDEAQPMADGRLPDGSRVNVILPPLVVGEPVLTLRRFPETMFTIDDLVAKGSLSQASADFLRLCIEGKLNVLVSGGTGTGKTTLLNVLSSAIPAHERIITIEDAAELRLGQPHVVSLESRPANIEGAGGVAIRDLVRNALRMRPDRVVIGECRGGEALDMLQAMNTGHEGSLTTVHANTPRDALSRLETMVLMSGFDLPLRAIREQIASAIDLVVQLQRRPDGTRVVSHITEVQGREGETITLQDVFLRPGATLASTGLRPRVVARLEDHGLAVPAALFRGSEPAAPGVKRRSR